MKRPIFPRINCVVPGCKRGSTRFAPDSEIICGEHWRKIPVAWRRRFSLYKRRYNAARIKADDRAIEVAGRCLDSRWRRMKALLTNPESIMVGGMPATIAEQLRREGLL